MASVRILRPPGTTRALYDAVGEKVNLEADPPAGLMMHAAGDVDGAWQVGGRLGV